MRKRSSSWSARLASAAFLLLWSAPAWSAEPAGGVEPSTPAASGQASDAVALDPAGLLLLSVSLDGLTLTEGMGAYGDPMDPLVPVGELARLLEADIDVMPPERRIVGRVGQARRSLVVDLRAGVARIAAQDVPLSPGDAAATATEIYLRVSVLEKLLGLKVEVAPDELALKLHAEEKFPVQARLERLAHRPDGSQVGRLDEPTLDIAQPYAFVTPPGFDMVLGAASDSQRQGRSFRYDLRMAGDLLWSNVQGYLGSDEQGRPANARLLLQRRSLEGNLLGPLHAREITAGDTYSPALALGPRSIAGRGVSLSTAPLEQTNIFNRIDLRGELPPGYDVELYVNDILRSSTNQSVNGRYEFLNVPLSPGVNVLRAVIYGPRGERREEVQVVNVGAALLRPGEAQFSFGIVDQDQPLIRFRHQGSVFGSDPRLFAPNGTRAVASLNLGLTNLLSMTAGVARMPRADGGAIGVYTLGARTSLVGLAAQLDSAWDGRGGSGLSVGLAGQAHGVSGVLRHAEYRDGFVDENNLGFNSALDLRRRSELSLDSSLNLRGRIVPTSLRIIRNGYLGGSNDLQVAARASSSLSSVLISAGLEYRRQAYRPSPATDTLTGYIAASTFRSYRWQVRTTFDYDIAPDFKARFLSVTIDRRLSDTWSMRFGLGEPLNRPSGWNLLLSSTYSTRYGDLALSGEYDNSDNDWRIAAQWNFGLGYNPVNGRYEVTRTGPGSSGSVLFNAFMDDNGDGVRQADEQPAPNVGIEGGAQRGAVTGADGRVLITGVGAGPTSHMDVSLEKLENAAVSTPPARVALHPRPGSITPVNYPMRPTGGIMVIVELLREDGKRVGLSSVRLQLVSSDGATVDGVTEFDGSAVFDMVPRGSYTLRLDPRQAEKLRMRMLQQPQVTIKGDGDYAPDVTVQVRFEPAPATAVASVGGG